jgi:hypothetical protein
MKMRDEKVGGEEGGDGEAQLLHERVTSTGSSESEQLLDSQVS